MNILPFQNDAKVELKGQGRMARENQSMEIETAMLKMKNNLTNYSELGTTPPHYLKFPRLTQVIWK